MIYVDNPVFKEILWEWRAFAIKVDPNICRNILNLPLKDGKSTKMLDRYICRLGYDTNIKIRDKDLRLKNLHDKTHEGIERWTTEVYIFPISAAIFRNITKALNIDLPERAIRDGQQLSLSFVSEPSQSSKMNVNNGIFSLIFTFVIIIIINVLRIRRSIQGTKVNVKKTIIFSASIVQFFTRTNQMMSNCGPKLNR